VERRPAERGRGGAGTRPAGGRALLVSLLPRSAPGHPHRLRV
jgi:hypothetical protein